MFTERKAAQMAAFFLEKRGGPMYLLKLIKLMYLADRQHYSSYGCPISDDCVVAMKHGPVLSQTLNLINGSYRDAIYWDGLISARENNKVALRRPLTERDSGDLSRSGLEAMGAVYDQFGRWNRWKLVDYTHTLPEWIDPGDSAVPIHPKDILAAVGKGPEEIEACLHNMEEDRKLAAAFASMRGKGQ
jgi:uncharacterized phage-associated protein